MPPSARKSKQSQTPHAQTGKLKIGDQWNAITIIALSQSNPLKALAEFVENSIDAGAKNVVIVRGKHKGEQYLKVSDDGQGVADFHYVATHIGDSIKRRLKASGTTGIQGEFGIGLLSFWTVGEKLSLSSTGADGKHRRLTLVKGQPSFSIREAQTLVSQPGTELDIRPVLPGVRMLSGEKIQSYLASELRDRISRNGIHIRVVDRTARKELVVEPRKFRGRLIHTLPEPKSAHGELYVELYMAEPSASNRVGLYRQGTRVLEDITSMEPFAHEPWTSGYLEGLVDVSFLQLTPGTRSGVVYDAALASLSDAFAEMEASLLDVIAAQRRAEEEEASRSIFRKVSKALREAFVMLPREEYGWLGTRSQERTASAADNAKNAGPGSTDPGTDEAPESGPAADGRDAAVIGDIIEDGTVTGAEGQKSFFEYPGPLFRVSISPTSSTVGIEETRKLHAIARDKSKRPIDTGIRFAWSVREGSGSIEPGEGEFVAYRATAEPEVARIRLTASQDDIVLEAEAVITVTAELIPKREGEQIPFKHGLPGYTYERAPGALRRSHYRVEQSLIVINNAHADFIFASKSDAAKLRYIARLYAKEIVLANFPGASPEELLERIVELTLYMEENLR